MLLPMIASANPVVIDGIYYNLTVNSQTAEVTSSPSKYSGIIIIPDKVTYETIDYNVTSIGDDAFRQCTNLTSVNLPNTITSIGYDAFSGCNLFSIDIPSSVKIIRASAFSSCNNLTSINLSEGLETIEQSTFANCIALTSISLPMSLKKLESGIFEGCSNLTSANIPGSIEGGLPNYMFTNCSSLTNINIAEGILYIGRSFERCTSLTTIRFPNSVRAIADDAFNGCTNLKKITFGTDLQYLYYNCFANCGELTDVYCLSTNVPTAYSSAFSNTQIELATLHVPQQSVNSYKAASIWRDYNDIIPYEIHVTLTADMGTLCAVDDLDFTNVAGLSAYIGSGFNSTTGVLTMTRVFDVPTGTGLVLVGTAGDYDIPYAASPSVYANLLKGVTENTVIWQTDLGCTNYVLANGANGVGFYLVDGSGQLAAGKAYLSIPSTQTTNAPVFIPEFMDGTTGINNLEQLGQTDSIWFDLQGRRISVPMKAGIYLNNGRKVVVR